MKMCKVIEAFIDSESVFLGLKMLVVFLSVYFSKMTYYLSLLKNQSFFFGGIRV
jgi:hypothetical protein